MERADRALYHAKESGRDRVERAASSTPKPRRLDLEPECDAVATGLGSAPQEPVRRAVDDMPVAVAVDIVDHPGGALAEAGDEPGQRRLERYRQVVFQAVAGAVERGLRVEPVARSG